MKTTYLVWKDPSCNGINPEWRELSGKEFLALIRSDAAKGRYFVRLGSSEPDGSDGEIVMEATEAIYKDWRREKRHKQHLRDSDPGYREVSYNAMEIGNRCCGEELLRDDNSDVEAERFRLFEREAVRAALALLNNDERRLAEYFWLSDVPGTERGYSALTGIPQKTVHNRKAAVLKRLKKFLAD